MPNNPKRQKTVTFNKLKDIAEFEFPEPEFFKAPKTDAKTVVKSKTKERDKAYEAFIQWSATPSNLREPKTERDFERIWKLPQQTCYSNFKKRADFHERKMRYFWDWVFDKFPDVIHAVYRRAIHNSTADAKIFAELVNKRMETQAPKPQMPPFMLIGVPQDKINALFIPEGYEDAEVVDGAK